MHNQDWELLVEVSRDTVSYGDPESEEAAGEFPLFLLYFLQVSVLKVSLKLKRGTIALCLCCFLWPSLVLY